MCIFSSLNGNSSQFKQSNLLMEFLKNLQFFLEITNMLKLNRIQLFRGNIF